jgi:hypothetical protein
MRNIPEYRHLRTFIVLVSWLGNSLFNDAISRVDVVLKCMRQRPVRENQGSEGRRHIKKCDSLFSCLRPRNKIRECISFVYLTSEHRLCVVSLM